MTSSHPVTCRKFSGKKSQLLAGFVSFFVILFKNNKMNRIVFLLIISVLFHFSFTNIGTELKVITESGLKNARLNISTYRQVKKAYPGGKTIKYKSSRRKIKGAARLINGETMPVKGREQKYVTRTYTIEKEGISFFFTPSGTLGRISIWGKNKFKTDKGIIIGVSTFDDLDSIYGQSAFMRVHSNLVKSYNNFTFYAHDSIVLKDSFSVKKEYGKLIIEKVVID